MALEDRQVAVETPLGNSQPFRNFQKAKSWPFGEQLEDRKSAVERRDRCLARWRVSDSETVFHRLFNPTHARDDLSSRFRVRRSVWADHVHQHGGAARRQRSERRHKAAVAEGTVSADRLDSYLKVQDELAELARQQEERARKMKR